MEKARDVWGSTLAELALQMTRATFEQLLSRSSVVDVDGDVLVVGVRTATACDWLNHQLIDIVLRVLREVGGDGLGVRFVVVDNPPSPPVVDGDVKTAVSPPSNGFGGFEPFRSNFVQTPSQYFEIVLPSGPPSVAAFVGAVIQKTIGDVVNYHTGERREWWGASYVEIGRATGLRSKASVGKAIRLARERGYVVRIVDDVGGMRYRLRRQGEPVDK